MLIVVEMEMSANLKDHRGHQSIYISEPLPKRFSTSRCCSIA